jgi:membrane protein
MQNKFLFLKEFLTKGIWSIKLSGIDKKKAAVIKVIRVIILSIRGFTQDRIQLRSSALTLYTLMSVVPVLALGFGIAKGFGYEKYLKSEMLKKFDNYQEVVNKLIEFATKLLERTQGGLVAGVGLMLLLWTVMKVFINIEISFNDIWQIKKARTLSRKFSDYLSMMVISPILFLASSTSNVFIHQTLSNINERFALFGYISPIFFFLLKLVPYVLIILLFTMVYVIMPNTKVKFKNGMIGGTIAGIAFILTQWVYVNFQVGVSKNNAIYGSFAALPLFIFWVQISWLIVLLGAKIAYAAQNVEMYEFENETTHMSDYSKRILAILMLNRLIKNFTQGLPALTSKELSEELKIPIRMINSVLFDLKKCHLVSEILTENTKTNAFQPAQYIERYSIKFVMENLDMLGEEYITLEDSEITQKIITSHQAFYKQIEQCPENLLIKNL